MPSKRNADERSRQRAISRRLGGQRGDAFQVVIADERGGMHSFNLTGVNATKQDTPAKIRRYLESHPEALEAKRDEFARRYHIAKSKLDIKNFEVRRVRRHVARAVEVVLRP